MKDLKENNEFILYDSNTILHFVEIIVKSSISQLNWSDDVIKIFANPLKILPPHHYYKNMPLLIKGQGLLSIHPFYLCLIVASFDNDLTQLKEILTSYLKNSFNQVDPFLYSRIINFDSSKDNFKMIDLYNLDIVSQLAINNIKEKVFSLLNKCIKSANIFHKFIDSRILKHLCKYNIFNKSYTFNDFINTKNYDYSNLIITNKITMPYNTKIQELANDIENWFDSNCKISISKDKKDLNNTIVTFKKQIFKIIQDLCVFLSKIIKLFKDVFLTQFCTREVLTKFYYEVSKLISSDYEDLAKMLNTPNNYRTLSDFSEFKKACDEYINKNGWIDMMITSEDYWWEWNDDFIKKSNIKNWTFIPKEANANNLERLIKNNCLSVNKILKDKRLSYKQLLNIYWSELLKYSKSKGFDYLVTKYNTRYNKWYIINDYARTIANIRKTLLHLFVMNLMPVANKNSQLLKKIALN